MSWKIENTKDSIFYWYVKEKEDPTEGYKRNISMSQGSRKKPITEKNEKSPSTV